MTEEYRQAKLIGEETDLFNELNEYYQNHMCDPLCLLYAEIISLRVRIREIHNKLLDKIDEELAQK
ncbi:MAG: hypothetical protein ACFFD4_02255 [Candidatus Odinarchaeota archaeon]